MNRHQKNKKRRCIVLIIGGIALFFIIKNILFPLEEFHAAVELGKIYWGDRLYIMGPRNRWSIDKLVGEEEESRGGALWSLEGDINRDYHVLAVSLPDIGTYMCKEYGYQVPEQGEITGIVSEFTSFPEKDSTCFDRATRFLKPESVGEIVREFQESREYQIFEQPELLLPYDYFFGIYACFEHCPASGACLGFLTRKDGQVLFLPGSCEEIFERDEENRKCIKEGAEFFYVDSDEVEQEVKKLERLHKEMVRSKEELLDRIAREQKEG